MFGVELKIIDEKGARAAPESGHARPSCSARGPTIVSGYYKNQDAVRQADRG